MNDSITAVQSFSYDQLDEEVQQFYDDIEQQVADANNQYRVAIGAIVQQVIDVRGRDEALAWFIHRFQKSERTMQRYLQAARGDDPYPELRQENNERYAKASTSVKFDNGRDNVINDANSSIESDSNLEEWLTLTESNVPSQPDSTDVDVAATIAENEKLRKEKETLQSQLQNALRQGTTSIPPKQHHTGSGGGGHHGLPTSTKDGVTRTMVNFDHWETTMITIPTGYACQEIQMGVQDDPENERKAIVYFQNKQRRRTAHLDPYATDKHTLAKMFEELARELRK